MKESNFQKTLIVQIKQSFPGAVVLKNDATYRQGIPDLSIFYGDRYAMLEVKADEMSLRQPNQAYYIKHFQDMGAFASFVYPENRTDVMYGLTRYFKHRDDASGGAHVSV